MAKSLTENQWLTDKLVPNVPLPESGNQRLIRDQKDPRGKEGWTSGFALRVTKAGTRSFVLSYRVKATGIERRLTIGSWPTWSVTAARAEARELKRRIDTGHDPLAEQQEARGAPTVADLCDEFLVEHVANRRPSTRQDYTAIIKHDIKPALGRKQVAAVATEDIEKLHREVSKRGAPYRANRVVAVASRMFTFAIKKKMRTDNPCRGIERNHEAKRKRYLKPDELARLVRALAEHEDKEAADIVRLLMLTGARKGEVLGAKWDQFDFDTGVWTKPASATKQNKEHEAPLNKPALQLVLELRKRRGESEFLFPGRLDAKTHRSGLKQDWARLCKAAGITGLRMHDLRHSYASALVSSGFSLPVIGELLGHADIKTTARYAHLYDSVTREATEKVGARYAGLVGKRPTKRKLKVVSGGAP
jgi:integrase